MPPHKSDSTEQQIGEIHIRSALQQLLGTELSDVYPSNHIKIKLDGFANGKVPTLIEIWSHQGKAKPGQIKKVMADFSKLLLAEKLLNKQCRKIFAVCDKKSLDFLKNSWHGRFATEFGIETITVNIDKNVLNKIKKAQTRQYR